LSQGKITLPHICPNCKIVKATTYQEVEEKFGFRNMDNKNYIRNQSWCRECRKKSAKK